MKDKIKGIIIGIVVTAGLYFLNFWFNFALAKFIIVPLFGTYICDTLNQLFNTASFTTQSFPLIFAWTSFIGSAVLWKSWNK